MSDFKLDTSKTYFRGKFVDFNEANVSIASSPVLYGLSIYTVFGASWNSREQKLYIFRLRDHYNRLVNSAKIMDFDDFASICSFEEFEKTMIELLQVNNIKQDVLVRATIFIDELVAGTKINGLKNSWSAYVYPMGEILPKTGANVCVSSWVRAADNAIPARAKVNGNYVNASLMKNEALQNGYDDAIALDVNGNVSEGTVANIFIIRDGLLITPHTTSDLLEGITRDTILKLAKHFSIAVESRSVNRTELYIAEEVFYSGSSAQITPIISVDKRKIGNGKPGKTTVEFMNYLDSLQRYNTPEFKHWLTIV